MHVSTLYLMSGDFFCSLFSRCERISLLWVELALDRSVLDRHKWLVRVGGIASQSLVQESVREQLERVKSAARGTKIKTKFLLSARAADLARGKLG